MGSALLSSDGHLHVISTTPASGKTVIATGLIRALRDRATRVFPFKPVAEAVLRGEGPALPEAMEHQCFAAGVAPLPEMSPIRVVPVGREADVWVFEDYFGRVPLLGRDMPALGSLPEEARLAIRLTLERCRAALLEQCDILVSEGAGAATAYLELGLEDQANIGIGGMANEVLLVARASNGTAFTTTERVIARLHEEGVAVTGFLLNDVAGCLDEHRRAAEAIACRSEVPFVGVMPWTDFFEHRPKYSPPSAGCDEDHRHLADLVNRVIPLDRRVTA